MTHLFKALVDQHQRLVYSQAVHMLADAAEAEDACQEVYERLWKYLNKHQNQEPLDIEGGKAWLLRVTRNLCIDKLRQRKPTTSEQMEDSPCDNPNNQPSAALAANQLGQWLRQAIAQLKEPYRSLITLADLQQRSIKEVAQTLNLSENRAKVYIHRGRKQLRTLLQGVEL